MTRFILIRIGQAILSIVAVSIIVFLLGRVTGDPVELLLPIDASEEDRVILTEHLGLDEPLWTQYFMFMGNVLKGDFGDSIRTGRPAMDMVQERFPATLQLAGVAIMISLIISIPIGVYSAKRRGGFFDFIARMLAVLGQSVPSFWLGILLIY